MADFIISPLEARVIGVLIEKQKTVPDSYPLSLNSIQNGCNQKSSRNPIMDASEAEIQVCLDNLKRQHFITEASGGRVMRYQHNAERLLQIPLPALAIIAILILRGPQTTAELRTNCSRLYDFADISSVESYCQELASRPKGNLVIELPLLPGSREKRWAHLLSGEPDISLLEKNVRQISTSEISSTELATLKSSMVQLNERVEKIEAALRALQKDLGIPTS